MKIGQEWFKDSQTIVDFFEKEYPKPSTKADPADLALTKKFNPAYVQLLKASGSDVAEKKKVFEEVLSEIDAALAKKNGRLFGGDHIDETDASLAPMIFRNAVWTLDYFKDYEFVDKYPNIKKYEEAITKTKAWESSKFKEEFVIEAWKGMGASSSH